ncbi:unnamed protein product [Effrenium voratum]|nr:unnamed protein product [Effrenium voratum]
MGCVQMPLLGLSLETRSERGLLDFQHFGSQLRQLLEDKGPLHLNSLPHFWDSAYGSGAWAKTRPVKSARKACNTYSNGVKVLNQEELLTPARSLTAPNCSHYYYEPEEHIRLEYTAQLPARVESSRQPAEVESQELATSQEESLQEVPSCQNRTSVFSIGSHGHPEFCARPCIYEARGACANGATCRFCHVPHQSMAKLDKRQRSTLQELENADILQLVYASLRVKMKRSRGQLPIQDLLRLVEDEMRQCEPANDLGPAAWEQKKRSMQSLQTVFSTMSVAAIVTVAKAPRFRPSFCDGIQALLEQRRA